MTPLSKDLAPSLRFYRSPLFHHVQTASLFEDSKTFADAEAIGDIDTILTQYQTSVEAKGFSLTGFIEQHFRLPNQKQLAAKAQQATVFKQIDVLWDSLKRPADTKTNGSLLPLPRSYTVPGGRFREIYYWDSYFTALGLIDAGRVDEVEAMLENFMSLQQRVGLIPNGNRSYYFSRSQPPVLALIAELIDDEKPLKDKKLQRITKALHLEWAFWMDGADDLNLETPTYRRVVQLDDGAILNRYWDDEDGPRPESYREDMEMAAQLAVGHKATFYRNVRAACESGWDFSSRWLAYSDDMSSIQTTNIIPVDLNCLMHRLELILAKFYIRLECEAEAANMAQRAATRERAINQHFWCDQQGFYFDLNLSNQNPTRVWSLAGIVPLFTALATQEQARRCAQHLATKFLKPGGLVTTTCMSSQQWDSPNGWAPLHWFAVKGLYLYGRDKLASKIMARWLNTVETYFSNYGKLMEKYDVIQPEVVAQGGEYQVQEGFGWTNGVTKRFYRMLSLDGVEG